MNWYRVAEVNQLNDGETLVVTAGVEEVALTFKDGKYGAINNACPHQGGPLGEGSLDADKCLHCPWHGWAINAFDGSGPNGENVTAYSVEQRDDGIYVAVEEEAVAATVSDVMIETMINWGVTHVFGMVGHSNLGLAEAIRKQELAGKLTFIGIRHEGAAAFACSGFAKASGKPAACLTIAGPGATNLLTGLWDAKVDRHPVLALTGQIQTQVLGPGAFQEIDLASAFDAATLWSRTVYHDSDPAELMSLALKHALVERGPTHLIFPDEVQVLEAAADAQATNSEGRLAQLDITPAKSSIDAAVKLLCHAKQPAIVVGYGAKAGMAEIIGLAEFIGAPVLSTFKAKGLIADHHPLGAGVLGRSGTPIAAESMTSSDALIVFGASFANHTGIDKSIPTIQVDTDQMTLGKFHPVDVPVWGDITLTASILLKELKAKKYQPQSREKQLEKLWADWREEKQKRAAKNNGKGLSSAALFDHLTKAVPHNAVLSVDVGNNTYSFGRYFECSGEQTVLMSGYLGSIGFGFPAAMGAWAAYPERAIVCITGDGGFGQYLAEFTTAVKYKMNITHILLNNGELGKISKEQRAGHWQVWQTSLHNPNFSEFAENCGGLGIRVTEEGQLDEAIAKALAYNGPALVEIITDAELI
ncbi:MAG: Rieske 2Fe-2S domain-containing protein [Pseudomonadales bacterium]|nr:Rieske 2Fe-2S domain-containing protein [Pseudomonadales bacterium]